MRIRNMTHSESLTINPYVSDVGVHFDTKTTTMKLYLIFLLVSLFHSISDGFVLREKRMWPDLEDDYMNSFTNNNG